LKPDQQALPRASKAEDTVAFAIWGWDRFGAAVKTSLVWIDAPT